MVARNQKLDDLRDIQLRCASLVATVQTFFIPGMKATLVVWHPERPGSEMLVGAPEIDEMIAALQSMKDRPQQQVKDLLP